MNTRKLLAEAVRNPESCRFADVTRLVRALGFHLSRVKGSHHIYVHRRIPELLNLQDVKGMTKAYQVRQVLKLIERYNLEVEPRD